MITYLKEDYPKLAERLAVPDEQLDKEICNALDLFDHGESYKGITAECVDYLPVDPTFMERLMIRYTQEQGQNIKKRVSVREDNIYELFPEENRQSEIQK